MRTILVVDDSPTIRKMVRAALGGLQDVGVCRSRHRTSGDRDFGHAPSTNGRARPEHARYAWAGRFEILTIAQPVSSTSCYGPHDARRRVESRRGVGSGCHVLHDQAVLPEFPRFIGPRAARYGAGFFAVAHDRTRPAIRIVVHGRLLCRGGRASPRDSAMSADARWRRAARPVVGAPRRTVSQLPFPERHLGDGRAARSGSARPSHGELSSGSSPRRDGARPGEPRDTSGRSQRARSGHRRAAGGTATSGG